MAQLEHTRDALQHIISVIKVLHRETYILSHGVFVFYEACLLFIFDITPVVASID